MTDTVGFVRHLPHDLVEAFRSTLEESTGADLLLHVVDASDPDPVGQIAAVRQVLADIGAEKVPELLAFNKIDRVATDDLLWLRGAYPAAQFCSAHTGAGVSELRAAVEQLLPSPEQSVDVLVPYSRGDLIDRIHRVGIIDRLEHGAHGTKVLARVPPDLADELTALAHE